MSEGGGGKEDKEKSGGKRTKKDKKKMINEAKGRGKKNSKVGQPNPHQHNHRKFKNLF